MLSSFKIHRTKDTLPNCLLKYAATEIMVHVAPPLVERCLAIPESRYCFRGD